MPIAFDPDSFRVSTCPRRTTMENSSPSRTTHSAAVAPPDMVRRTISCASSRRSVSSLWFRGSSWVWDIEIHHSAVAFLCVPSCPLWLWHLKASTTEDTKVHKGKHRQIHSQVYCMKP